MGKSKIDAAALFLALIAGAFVFGALPYGWITGIGGLIVLIVLFGYDHAGVRTGLQSVAFSAVCGFALMLIVAAFFQSGALGNPANVLIYTEYLPIAWVCATFVFTMIDRVRMANRFQESLGPTSLGIPPDVRYERVKAATAARPGPEPVPVRPEAREEAPVVLPEAEAAPASEPELGAAPEPAAPEHVVEPAHAAVASVPEHAVPVAHRKETSIYVNLVGEGVAMMRTVRAEHMGKDFYLITEPMPEGERWEFTTGQIVRCKKKSLSHGKGLVAVQEAPRAS